LVDVASDHSKTRSGIFAPTHKILRNVSAGEERSFSCTHLYSLESLLRLKNIFCSRFGFYAVDIEGRFGRFFENDLKG
jgi:hypothetical protein